MVRETMTGGRIRGIVAAAIGVLTRFAIEQYRSSLLYQGKAAILPAAPGPVGSKARRSRKSGGAGEGA